MAFYQEGRDVYFENELWYFSSELASLAVTGVVVILPDEFLGCRNNLTLVVIELRRSRR